MSETPPEKSQDKPEDTPVKKAAKIIGKANEACESVATVADTANNVFSAVKWVAIAISLGLVIFVGSAVYKLVTAPARVVGNAAEAVTDTVKSGASTVKEGTADIISRLVIKTPNQRALDIAAEAAFKTVTNIPAAAPDNMKQRVFWTANFGGHENKVCELSLKFGETDIPVFIAADNKDYATSKSLGSKNGRLMRILIRADGDNLAINTEWDNEASAWVIKWKANTIKKSLDDGDAAKRVMDVLGVAARDCQT